MNLLPVAEKLAIKKEYKRRLALVVLIFFAILVCIVLIPVATSYMVSNFEIMNLEREVELANKANLAKGVFADMDLIKDVNNKVNILSRKYPDYLGYDVSSIFSSIIATSTKVKVISLSYDQVSIKKGQSKETGHRIVLIGVADDRDSLQRFVKTLRSDKRFDSVDLPVSDLIESSNIKFSVTVMINKK